MFVVVRVNRASRDVAGGRTNINLASLIIVMMDSAVVNAKDANRRQRRPGTHNVPIIMANNLN